LYLAVIFNPIFTASYPNSMLVERISLFGAMLRALSAPEAAPRGARLVTIASLMRENPGRTIVVFPECTTSNGRGVLAFSPGLLSAPPSAKIFPVCLRYTPSDVTTPLPGAYISFLWDLCSRPTHSIRVRIAEAVRVAERRKIGDEPDAWDVGETFSSAETLTEDSGPSEMTGEDKKLLDRVADDLARLGRAKRVGLGVESKIAFIKAWTKTRTIW
jgi:1-acylglycerol-3-phosphate O-acyltransferase